MSKANNPRERIRAVLPRITEVLWLTPLSTDVASIHFHHFPHLVSLHILYFLFMFCGSAVGEVERSLFLDEAGRGVGAGDVFGAMRSLIVNRPLLQLDVAGSIRILTLLIRASA